MSDTTLDAAPADAPIEITVDINSLTLGDMETLESIGSGNANVSEMIRFLDRVAKIPGGARSLKVMQLREVFLQINAGLREAANPKGPPDAAIP